MFVDPVAEFLFDCGWCLVGVEGFDFVEESVFCVHVCDVFSHAGMNFVKRVVDGFCDVFFFFEV